jgi:hypothetical protein
MLPQLDFDRYRLETHDSLNDEPPLLRTTDLPMVAAKPKVKLSIFISANSFRYGQLGRCLETLARQKWRDFEVLIADNGHTPPLLPLVELFRPHMPIQYLRRERDRFVCCPTDGWKALMPLAKGEVWAITQPEMMFDSDSAWRLWAWHFEKPSKEEAFYQIISRTDMSFKDRPTWVTLKPYFMNEHDQFGIDDVDWHSDIRNLEKLPEFWSHHCGLSNMTNGRVRQFKEWPWWLAASALAKDPIWSDMPITKGHATIDLWFCNYRHVFCYVDITPRGEGTCYHQYHARTAVSPVGEQETVSISNILDQAKASGRTLPSGGPS